MMMMMMLVLLRPPIGRYEVSSGGSRLEPASSVAGGVRHG